MANKQIVLHYANFKQKYSFLIQMRVFQFRLIQNNFPNYLINQRGNNCQFLFPYFKSIKKTYKITKNKKDNKCHLHIFP